MEEFIDFITLEISDSSTVPKYKQIADSIAAKVERGAIRSGQKLPSINQLSTYYLLSRDTVEKAYAELKNRKIIVSTRGLGYYISSTLPSSQLKVLVLFNKLSAYKKEIYNSMAHNLAGRANMNLQIYHCDFKIFKEVLEANLEGYHYYVIMPHFSDYDPIELSALLSQIPEEKLIVLDNLCKGIENYFGCIYQDFLEDIFDALTRSKDLLNKYKRLTLVFPDSNTYPYPKEIIQGFSKFCQFNSFPYEIFSSMNEVEDLRKGDVFVLISESDLAKLVKRARAMGLEIGNDIGIISYNDTELKEVLENGITVMSTDFTSMGSLASKVILNAQPINHKNDFNLIRRSSL